MRCPFVGFTAQRLFFPYRGNLPTEASEATTRAARGCQVAGSRRAASIGRAATSRGLARYIARRRPDLPGACCVTPNVCRAPPGRGEPRRPPGAAAWGTSCGRGSARGANSGGGGHGGAAQRPRGGAEGREAGRAGHLRGSPGIRDLSSVLLAKFSASVIFNENGLFFGHIFSLGL